MANVVDLSNIYELHDPFSDRAYRGCDDDASAADDIAVSRGEASLARVVTIRWAMGGGTPGDVIWLTSGVWTHIVGPRFIEVLERGGFCGWRTHPVRVLDKSGALVPGYRWLAVDGRCDAQDLSRSQVVVKEYPGGWFPEFKGVYFAEDTWDGCDLFIHRADERGWGSTRVLATDAVVRALKKARVGNLRYERLPDIQVSVSTYTGSNAYRLPADIDEQVEHAYRTAGVPRPPERPPPPRPIKGNDFLESAVDADSLFEISDLSQSACKKLGVDWDCETDDIVKAMSRHIEAVRPLKGEALREEAMSLSALMGALLVRSLGWMWVEVKGPENQEMIQPAVVPEDRSVAVLPVSYVGRLLVNEGRENNLVALFRLLASGRLPAANPGSYVILD